MIIVNSSNLSNSHYSLLTIKYFIKNVTNKIESLTSISIANGLPILSICFYQKGKCK